MIFSDFLTEKNPDDVVVTPARRPHEAAHLVHTSGVHVDAARQELLGDVGVALQRRDEYVHIRYAMKLHIHTMDFQLYVAH